MAQPADQSDHTKPARQGVLLAVWRPVWRAITNFFAHEAPSSAGYMAFSALLAMFPFIVFLVSLSGVIGQTEQVREFVDYAFEYLPDEVGQALYPVISSIIQQPPREGILTISILGTLWVSSSGVEALRTAMDRAYGAPDRRPFWWRRLQGLAFVVVGAMAILVVMITIVIGPLIWQAVNYLFEIPEDLFGLYNTVRYATGALGLFIVICVLYRFLPNVRQRWFHVLPGAFFACVSWLVIATLYSLYLSNVGNYSVTYGSLGGVIGALMFFFVSAMVFIFGAELNASIMQALRDRAAKES
ncbi:MAG: YihY/virulence factor BrkB family protein [Pseudomonadota bacterium]